MENPSGVEPAKENVPDQAPTPAPMAPAEPMASPAADLGAATPGDAGSSSPAPSPPPSRWSSPARSPADRARSNLKVAGVVMVLVGALMTYLFFGPATSLDHQLTDDEAKLAADRAGGDISIEFMGSSPANVTIRDYNGTALSNATAASGTPLVLQPGKAAVRLTIAADGKTWTRNAFLVPGFTTHVPIDASAPSDQSAWLQPDLSGYKWLWGIVAASIFVIFAGLLTFRGRAPRIAMAGAVLFLGGSIAMVLLTYKAAGLNFTFLLQPALFAVMAGFSVWAIRQGWDQFKPVAVGPLKV